MLAAVKKKASSRKLSEGAVRLFRVSSEPRPYADECIMEPFLTI